MILNYNSLSSGRDTWFKRTWQKKAALLLLFALFSVVGVNAQVDLTASGGTPTASYATLKGAFDAINLGTHTGTITIGISASTSETASAVLNASGSGAASYTGITISPTGGAARTISGAIAAGSPLIDLNGADNVIFDGLNTGGNSLTLSNTTASATSGTSTVRFILDATGNTITNCSVLGSFSAAVGTNGGNIFFSTGTTTGNDNNTISNCNITAAGANLPTKGIYGNGSTTTTAIGNSGIVITNNNIYDYFGAAVTSAGIYTAGGCNTWSITNNKFYQTGTRTWTTGAQHSAIWILSSTATSGAQLFTVTGNTIGYNSNLGTGTYTLTGSTGKFLGIVYTGITGLASASTISSNTIANVSLSGVTSSGTSTSSPFIGIYVGAGTVTANSNTIGSQSAAGSLVFSTNSTTATDFYGLYNFGSDAWTTSNNTIGGVSITNVAASGTQIFYGIRVNTGSGVTWTANGNTIGGSVANSIQLTSTGASSQMFGLFTSNAASTITSNTIRNFTNNNGTGTGSTASIVGIGVGATSANHTVGSNTIFNLSNTLAGFASVNGINFSSSTGTNVIEKNLIYDLNAANASATLNGINVIGGTATYKNNMIRLGTSGSSATVGMTINGIAETLAGTDNFYNNSVYIGGAPTTAASNSFAFQSSITTNTRAYQNNIFYNARSNSGSTGKHYAIRVGGTAALPAGLTSNYNILFANGTGGFTGLFNAVDRVALSDWKTATGTDGNSFSALPPYLAPTAATPNLHLDATIATVAEGLGLAIGSVTDDFDGQTRSGLTPSDIGADALNGTGPAVVAINSATASPLGTQCTATARTISANITAGASDITSVTLNFAFNGIAQTPIAMTGGTLTSGATSTFTATIPAATPTNALVTWSVVAVDPVVTRNLSGTSYADEPALGVSGVASVSASPICNGSSTVVSAVLNKAINATLGLGASTSGSSGSTLFPGAWGGAKTQFLIKASELSAAGLTAGPITSLSFEPTTSGQTYQGFAVNIAPTALTAMTSTLVNANLTQVYAGTLANNGFLPVANVVNTLAFGTGAGSSSSFVWDGTSNIIVSFCWSSVPANSTSTSTTVKVDSPGFTCTGYGQSDSLTPAALCALTTGFGTSGTGTSRPKFTFAGNGSPAIASILWSNGAVTATQTVSPLVDTNYSAVITVAGGCTITTNTVAVVVNPIPTAPTVTPSTQCGSQVPTASVSDPNTFTTPNFKWYADNVTTTALQTSPSTTYLAAVGATTTFFVSVVNPTTGCESARTSVAVTVVAPDPVTVVASVPSTPASGSFCLGTALSLGATGSYADYSWTVSPNDGTGGFTGATTIASTGALTTTPTAPGVYTYTVSNSGGGCLATATYVLTVVAPPTIVVPTPSAVCNGTPVTLTALTGAIGPGTATIGTATTLTSATSQPTAFCNRWPSYRMQTVYTAAELTAAGLVAGNITSMAFNITSLGDGATNAGFEVKIGNTAVSTMSGDFTSTATGFTTVYPAQTYTHAVGVNTIPFSTPFAWNGTSNIIVEVIHSGANLTNNSTTYYTATAGNTVAYTTTASTNAASFSTQRLNVTFGGQAQTLGVGSLSYIWNDPLNTTGNVLTVTPSTTTSYTVSGFDSVSGCTGTKTVTVTVNAIPTALTVTPSTQCGAGVPTVSVSDTNGFTTPTIKWYDDNVTTTALQSSTATTYATSISTPTTFWVSVVNPTTGCESARTSVLADVTAPTAIFASIVGGDSSLCIGESVQMLVTSANDPNYTYTWTAAAGSGIVGSFVGANPTFTPSAAGSYVYTVTATGGGCTTSATLSVTVGTIPVITSATASVSAVCPGGISALTATLPVSGAGGYALSSATAGTYTPITGTTITTATTDDDGAGNLPIGFTFTYNGVAQTVFGASTNGLLLLGNTSASIAGLSSNALASNANAIAPFWDDNNTVGGSMIYATTGTAPNRVLTVQWTDLHIGGSGSTTNPTFSFQAKLYEGGKIEFVYGPKSAALSSPAASVGISTAVGTYLSVTPLSPLASTTTSGSVENTSVTEANLPSGTTLTFTVPTASSITWSPYTDLYLNADGTGVYSGQVAAVVYAKPTVTTAYTARATNAAGCYIDSTPVTVIQNGVAVDPITGGATAICLGDVTPVTFVSTNGVTWNSSNTAVATIDADGILSVTGVGATTISAFIYNPSNLCTSNAPNTVTVNVYAPVVLTGQPQAQSLPIYDGITPTLATFSVATTGSVNAVNGYQWSVSTDGVNFDPITDGGNYSGATTATLSVTNAPVGLNQTYYRCQVSGYGACVNPPVSSAAVLTVAAISVNLQPVMNPISLCGSGNATFDVGFSLTPDIIQWQYSTDGGATYNDISGTIGGLTFTGFDATTLSVTGLTTANNNWKVIALAALGETVVTSNPATIVVVTPATVSSPGNQIVCSSGGTSTFTVTAANNTGIQWEYSADNVTFAPVANGTPAGTTYTTPTSTSLGVVTTSGTPVPGVAYYYRAAVTGASPCLVATSATAGTLTINDPNVQVSASSSFYCTPAGSSVTLNATGATTYSWSPATGLSATTGASVVATPTATTTYTVTGTLNGCTKSAQITVTVGTTPVVTTTASPAVLCPNTNSFLLADTPAILGNTVTEYGFSPGSSTYADITGATTFSVIGGGGTLDDGYSTLQNLGFTFKFAGNDFTNFSMNSNGYLRLGAVASASSYSVFSSTTENNVISFNNRDMNNNAGSLYSFVVEGSAPNRICKIQAKNFYRYNTTTHTGNAQVWLYEGSNKIEMRYGVYNTAWTSGTTNIGLKGGATDVRSISSTTWAGITAASITNLTSGTVTQGTTNQVVSGTMFTFTPPTVYTYTYAWSPSTFIAGQEAIANPVATNVTSDITYTVVVTNNIGCSTTKTVALTVASGVAITQQPTSVTVCQGSPASFSVTATGANLTYQWRRNEVNITTNPTATTPTLSFTSGQPADSGNYTVLVTPLCGAPLNSNAVNFTVNPTPTAVAPSAQSYCGGSATTAIPLTGTPSGVVFDITGGAAIGLANQTGVTAIPAYTPIAGTATITITPRANTCTGTPVTYTVTVNSLPGTVAVSPATTLTCPDNAPTLLTASVPAYVITGAIGTGTSSAGTTSYPNPFSAFYGGAKHQMIYTAAELSALGFTSTTPIASVALDISAFAANACTNMTIRMKNTASTVLTGLEAGTVTVYGPQTFTPSATGWASFTLTAPFAWDGVSNVIVEFVHNAGNGGNGSGTTVRYTTMATNLTYYGAKDNVTGGIAGYDAIATGGFSSQGLTLNRPNIKFGASVALPVTWTPITGLYTDVDGLIPYTTNSPSATVYAKPTVTTTYVAKATTPIGCFTTGTAVVTISSLYPFYADTDGDGYGAGTVQSLCALSPTTPPSGYSVNGTDCAPTDPTKWRTGDFYTDADNDGYYNGNPIPTTVCYGASTPLGYTPSIVGTDCDDTNFEVNPNHVEVLGNGIDDNCDGTIDEVAPTSSLQPTQCGVTLTNIAQAIYANVVTGPVAAMAYRFEVTNGATTRIYESPTNSFNLQNLAGGAAYNTTYTIRVAVKTAPGFWRAYSTSCTVTTPAVAATTNVSFPACGITLSNIASTIYCDAVTNATGYRFRVTDGITTSTFDTTVNRFNLTNVNANFGTTYTIDVQLKFGTTWETTWGSVCNFTTPATPGTSNVIAAQCGVNITNLWATIYATQISVATGYRFEVTKGAQTVFYDTPNARFSLRNITVPGFTVANASYSIRVAILYNSIYQPFGSACTITTNGAARVANAPIDVFEVKAYPNPFAANFKLEINTSSESNVGVKVYDMIGREIEVRQSSLSQMTALEIGDLYPTGVYNIVVTQGDKVKTLRVIKR